MKRKSIIILAIAVVLIIGILFVAPSMNVQTLGVQYSTSPAKATITMTSFRTYTQTVQISNLALSPLTVTVTPIPPKYTYAGFIPIPVTTWVTGPSTSLVVPGGKTVTATFSINIPKMQSYVGKHYEVWIQASPMFASGFNVIYNMRWMINTPTKLA